MTKTTLRGGRRPPSKVVPSRVDLGRLLSNPGRYAAALEALWAKLPSLDTALPPKEPRQAPQTRQRPTDKHIEAIVTGYQEGATIRQLAIKHRIGRVTVSKILKQNGVKMRGTGLTSQQLDDAERLYADGWSLAKIADRFSVDSKTVWNRLAERGVKMRDTHGRPT
ncbi:hypothetical protein RM479_20855 [Nocardiopsis sp. DSM 44743]|uniref:Helix-turn-helix domain-containing protein n=1 Tax=Nocardiopsis lambiniae TaxID=3075539 RepID=A0ABU2ME37_9ACTN|nr:hypothetical protein [Nocardiopsis sp. DSM 44743]